MKFAFRRKNWDLTNYSQVDKYILGKLGRVQTVMGQSSLDSKRAGPILCHNCTLDGDLYLI